MYLIIWVILRMYLHKLEFYLSDALCANIAYVKAPTESDFPVCSDNWRCDGELCGCVTGGSLTV